MRIIICCIAVLLLISSCLLAGGTGGGRVVMVIAGNTSIRDFTQPGLPHLAELLRTGSAALMNVRTGRAGSDVEPVAGPGMEAGCVSLGAGAMAVGGMEVRRASDAEGTLDGVSAAALYEFRTDVSAGDAEVLHTEISRIRRANAAAAYHARPGALGSALQDAGIKTAVVGNSDLPGEPHREAVAVAMNAAGTVNFGDVDSRRFKLSDPDSPYGMRTNSDVLLRVLRRVLPKSGFIVVDFGDTLRADMHAEQCTDDWAALVRHGALRRLDDFVGRLMGELDFAGDTLIVLSPSARTFGDAAERLTPVVIVGPRFKSGILTSPSTRRPGVVTISDIAPTVLNSLGVKSPPEMVGRPVESIPNQSTVADLLKLHADTIEQTERQVAMRGASVVQSLVVVLVTLAVALGVGGRLSRVVEWAALIPVALPIAMLALPEFYLGGLNGSVLITVGLVVAILGVSRLALRSAGRAFAWMCAVIVLGLVIDMARGAPLASLSIAGYSIAEGARYYGIGNELMGTLIAATLLGVGAVLTGSRLRGGLRDALAVLVFAIVFITIGSPMLGANMGGAMAAAPAMGVTMLARRGWRPSVKGLVILAGMTVLVIGALFAADLLRGGTSQSHAGRILDQAAGGNAGGALMVIQRKIALNIMLISTSLWSRLLALSVVGSVLLFRLGGRRHGAGMLGFDDTAAVLGTCVGLVGAFAFNDSGVVAAATCSVILWTMLVLRFFRPTWKSEGG